MRSAYASDAGWASGVVVGTHGNTLSDLGWGPWSWPRRALSMQAAWCGAVRRGWPNLQSSCKMAKISSFVFRNPVVRLEIHIRLKHDRKMRLGRKSSCFQKCL